MKKYILFIVEGTNDKREIGAMLRASCGSKFLEKYVDKYYVCRGDITSDYGVKSIRKKLNEIVAEWRNGKCEPYTIIRPSDVERIIHIIDMDGVYIPNDSVCQGDVGKTQYYSNYILCNNRKMIIKRNKDKASVIDLLLETELIDNIRYNIFFASCNMDHLLFNDGNLDPSDKERKGFEFAKRCIDNQYLQDSIFAQGICSSGSYEESWEMIKMDHNSLKRHTNLNMLLDDIWSN